MAQTGTTAIAARGSIFEAEALRATAVEPTTEAVCASSLDGRFVLTKYTAPGSSGPVWVRLRRLAAEQPLDAYVDPHGASLGNTSYAAETLERALGRAGQHTRFLALALGALLAMALTTLVIWFVLMDRLFILYVALFGLQALYVLYLSGQGFDWAVLRHAPALASDVWKAPAALSGAVACLLVRSIAHLRYFSPRVYRVFGGLAAASVLLACANAIDMFRFGALISGVGNLMLVGTAAFAVMAAFLAWPRSTQATGWFLIAWTLEGLTTATAAWLLLVDTDAAEQLLHFGLPLSMIGASVLTALGVADRLGDRLHTQWHALTDAERRAQTDALTGVLNRRALFEQLERVSLRARTQDVPVTLLFIDLDHFKAINDFFGHAAGDACLRAVVGPIQAELRQSDVFGRYGGEEFVVILSSVDTVVAHAIAERIRERVATVAVEGFGAPIRLTCSIGVAGSDALRIWGEQLLARADQAVYGAKNAGRNRVEVALPLPA